MNASDILRNKREKLEMSSTSVERQHKRGKLTARERIDLLFDKGTFHEISAYASDRKDHPGDGVIIGYGKVDGHTVFASFEDFTVLGGSVGRVHASKICKIMDMAYNARCPYISVNDSGGARIDEGIIGLNGYGEIFRRNVRYSGTIPQLAVILGPAAGGACYSPALMDAVFLCKDISLMFLTGPEVTKSVIFQDFRPDELGGWQMHAKSSGVGHYVYESEKECFQGVRQFLSYIPYLDYSFKSRKPELEIEGIVPINDRTTYDMRNLMRAIFDNGSLMEQHELFAANCITSFARLDGHPVGVVANQPRVLSGALDYKSGMKISRFVRFCNAFGLPVITLVDVPAFMPGKMQEANSIISHGAKIIYAYAEATVPLITVIIRKAYGGAYIAMGSKSLGADITFAWPQAEIAVMGAAGAIPILHRKDIAYMTKEQIRELEDKYSAEYSNPYQAENALLVDEIIYPEETRERLISSLNALANKPSDGITHGNIPL